MTDFQKFVQRTEAFDATYGASNISTTAVHPDISGRNTNIECMGSNEARKMEDEGATTLTTDNYPGVSVRAFTKARRNAYVEWMESNEAREENTGNTAAIAEYSKYRTVLEKLRAWHEWDTTRRKSLTSFVLSMLGLRRRPVCPSEDDLYELALFHFPLCAHIKARICDFHIGGVTTFEQSVDKIEKGMAPGILPCSKPLTPLQSGPRNRTGLSFVGCRFHEVHFVTYS